MSTVICRTCGVEHAERVSVCAICEDDRQWVPAGGQAWTSLEEMRAGGYAVQVDAIEPGLLGITSTPAVGIGQQSKLLQTPAGNLLWDPIGYVDDDAIRTVLAFGRVTAISSSHPHMFGAQVEWSRALDDAPVYVCAPNLPWVARPDPVIRTWEGTLEPIRGVRLVQAGGHFSGSAFVHFTAPDGAGVVLSSDTVYVNPDRATVAFMRSFPNHIPQSPAVVEHLVAALDAYPYDRIYGNFANGIVNDARAAVQRSAERHVAWVRGAFDDRASVGPAASKRSPAPEGS